jgi:hypothetical protein
MKKLKLVIAQEELEGEFVRIVDTTYSDAEINELYSKYRVSVEGHMLASKYRSSSSSVSSSSSSAPSEKKQSQKDKRIEYVEKHKQLTAINAQLRVLETMTLNQQQRKQQSKLTKNQTKLSKRLQTLSTQLNLNQEHPDFNSEPGQVMLGEWLQNQVTVILPRSIVKHKLQWKHALWVNDKPQIRDKVAQAKQKHATRKRNDVQLKRENLMAKVLLFNETLKEIPLLQRPTGLTEINTSTSPLEKAIEMGLGPYSGHVTGDDHCPVELKRLFAFKDKRARITRGLEINRDDRKYLAHYLETQQRDLKEASSHAHFTLSTFDVCMAANRTTEAYAGRGLLTKRLHEVTNVLTLVRSDMSAFLISCTSSASSVSTDVHAVSSSTESPATRSVVSASN